MTSWTMSRTDSPERSPTMIAFVLGAALLGSFCLALTACVAVSLL